MRVGRTGIGVPVGTTGGVESQTAPVMAEIPKVDFPEVLANEEAEAAARRIVPPARISAIIDPARQPTHPPLNYVEKDEQEA